MSHSLIVTTAAGHCSPPSFAARRPPRTLRGAEVHSEDSRRRRRAARRCRRLQAQVVGEPVRVSVCLCLACRRQTGTVFGAPTLFRCETVTVVGTNTEYVLTGDEVTKATFRSCPKCGATVDRTLEGHPKRWAWFSARLPIHRFRRRASSSTRSASAPGSNRPALASAWDETSSASYPIHRADGDEAWPLADRSCRTLGHTRAEGSDALRHDRMPALT